MDKLTYKKELAKKVKSALHRSFKNAAANSFTETDELAMVQTLILKLSEDEQRELYRWMHRELNVYE